MTKNENETPLIKLTLAFRLGEKDIHPSQIKSIISLSPFICDIRTTDVPQYTFTVEHSLVEVLLKCAEAGYPIFKSTANIGPVKQILDVPSYRKMNFDV